MILVWLNLSKLALQLIQLLPYRSGHAELRTSDRTEKMAARFDYGTAAPGVYDAMDAVDQYLAQSSISSTLLLLVQLRASQVNGCAYCLNMHWRDLRNMGESEQRL